MPKKSTKSSKRVQPKPKADVWFYAVRGSYLPCSWQGWALYVPFIVFLITVFMSATHNQHSASDAFYAIFPQWVAAAVVMTWIAKLKSAK